MGIYCDFYIWLCTISLFQTLDMRRGAALSIYSCLVALMEDIIASVLDRGRFGTRSGAAGIPGKRLIEQFYFVFRWKKHGQNMITFSDEIS